MCGGGVAPKCSIIALIKLNWPGVGGGGLLEEQKVIIKKVGSLGGFFFLLWLAAIERRRSTFQLYKRIFVRGAGGYI